MTFKSSDLRLRLAGSKDIVAYVVISVPRASLADTQAFKVYRWYVTLHVQRLGGGRGSSCCLCGLADGAHVRVGSWTRGRAGQQTGGGSDAERGSAGLQKARLSSGFPRLLLWNPPRGIADQSSARSAASFTHL